MVLIKSFSIGQRWSIVVIVIICVILTETQHVNGQQNNTASTASSSGQSSSGTNTVHSSNSTTTAHTNATATTGANSTIASNSTIVTTSATPTTFPVASYPSTGALQGTAQAPFPGNSGNGNKNALGPDDSYIASALALLPSTLLATCMLAILLATVWLL